MSIQPIRKHLAPEIPDKLYFRIGDVARLCQVPAYVLRFWETEFPQLRPNKGGTGQRLYRKRDVEMAFRIKSLLYDQGYTIPGARQVFKNETKSKETAAAEAALPIAVATSAAAAISTTATEIVPEDQSGGAIRRTAALRAVRDELCALLAMLEQPLSLPIERAVSSPPKVQALRPRLVIEPRPTVLPTETLRLVVDSRTQGDLFPAQ